MAKWLGKILYKNVSGEAGWKLRFDIAVAVISLVLAAP
jgi:hypothetical protein